MGSKRLPSAVVVVTSLLIFTSVASAKWIRVAGNYCQINNGANVTLGSWGNALYTSSTGGGWVSCPMPHRDDFEMHDINTLNIHGYDGDGAQKVIARVCVESWDTDSLSCGTDATTLVGGTGDYTLKPSRTVIQGASGADFAWIDIMLGKSSSVRGLYFATP